MVARQPPASIINEWAAQMVMNAVAAHLAATLIHFHQKKEPMLSACHGLGLLRVHSDLPAQWSESWQVMHVQAIGPA